MDRYIFLLPPKSVRFLPFGDLPNHNHSYCKQVEDGFVILAEDKETEVLRVRTKIVSTRSHYSVVRSVDGVAIASIDQNQIENKYTISGVNDQPIAEIVYSDDSITITLESGNSYTSKPKTRGKSFEFTTDGKMVITVDKKSLSMKDSYHTVFIDQFPALVAQLIPVVIDEIYHSGVGY